MNSEIIEQDQFTEMERRDEEQILAEIQGKVIDEMFYEFKMGGRTVTGISFVGTKEIARRYGKIETEFVTLQDLGDQWMSVFKATDKQTGTTLTGSSTILKIRVKRDGTEEPNTFAIQTVNSKAQRNAIRAVIPETYILEMIKAWKNRNKGTIKPEPQKPAPKKVESSSKVVQKPPKEEPWRAEPATGNQLEYLDKYGVAYSDDITKGEASDILNEFMGGGNR